MQYLAENGWEIMDATNEFYKHQLQGKDGAPANYSGPRTLDGRPAPQSKSRSSRATAQPKRKGLATLGSLGGGPSNAQNAHDDHDDDEDYSSDDDNGNRGNLFAGGEKSGLAVQDPDQGGGGSRKIISDILAKARE